MSEKVGALVAAAVVVAIMAFLHSGMAEAYKNYVVGTTETNNWSILTSPYYYSPNGSTHLKAGDTLQFIYVKEVHNVVGVGKKGYDTCDGTGGSIPFTSGNDKIALKEGWNYFICTSKPEHCETYNMKIAVKAT